MPYYSLSFKVLFPTLLLKINPSLHEKFLPSYFIPIPLGTPPTSPPQLIYSFLIILYYSLLFKLLLPTLLLKINPSLHKKFLPAYFILIPPGTPPTSLPQFIYSFLIMPCYFLPFKLLLPTLLLTINPSLHKKFLPAYFILIPSGTSCVLPLYSLSHFFI